VIKAALPAMRRRRAGHVVNVTSVSGLAAWHGTAIYGATKFALECLGRTLAQEVALADQGHQCRARRVAHRLFRRSPARRRSGDCRLCRHGPSGARVPQDKHGSEPGCPDLAAQAILAALDEPEPPLVLLLGEDALHYAERELGELAAQFDRRRYTLAIAAEAAQAAQ
jgi:NADP-dependent 3-hydroxy acid dehydrogenase YdfG